MVAQRRIDFMKSAIAILACSCRFTAGFFLGLHYPGEGAGDVLLTWVLTITVLVAVMCAAFRAPVSLRSVAVLSIVLVFAQLALQFVPLAGFDGARAALLCLATAFGTLVVGAILVFFPARQARRNLIVSFALSALILPAFHRFTALDDRSIQQLMMLVFACAATVFLLVEKRTGKPFPKAAAGTPSLKGWVAATGRLFSLKDPNSVMLLGAIMFFFGFGVLEEYASSRAVRISSSDAAMVAVFLLSMLLVAANRRGRIESTVRGGFVAVWVVWLAGFALVLVLPEFSPVLFAVISTATTIVNLPILITVLDDALETRLSPLFLFGLAMSLLFVSHTGGQLATLGMVWLLGPESFSLTALLTVTFFAMLAIVIVLLFRSTQRGRTATSPSDAGVSDGYAAILATLAQERGLTDRELDVLKLYCQGRTAAYIASQRYVSESTVKTYISRAYGKLGVHGKQELLTLLETCGRFDDAP